MPWTLVALRDDVDEALFDDDVHLHARVSDVAGGWLAGLTIASACAALYDALARR